VASPSPSAGLLAGLSLCGLVLTATGALASHYNSQLVGTLLTSIGGAIFGAATSLLLATINTENHCRPAISSTESIGYGFWVRPLGSWVAEGPVKWAFFQKASRSKSVESGKG
jgi:hypothetical protein